MHRGKTGTQAGTHAHTHTCLPQKGGGKEVVPGSCVFGCQAAHMRVCMHVHVCTRTCVRAHVRASLHPCVPARRSSTGDRPAGRAVFHTEALLQVCVGWSRLFLEGSHTRMTAYTHACILARARTHTSHPYRWLYRFKGDICRFEHGAPDDRRRHMLVGVCSSRDLPANDSKHMLRLARHA